MTDETQTGTNHRQEVKHGTMTGGNVKIKQETMNTPNKTHEQRQKTRIISERKHLLFDPTIRTTEYTKSRQLDKLKAPDSRIILVSHV